MLLGAALIGGPHTGLSLPYRFDVQYLSPSLDNLNTPQIRSGNQSGDNQTCEQPADEKHPDAKQTVSTDAIIPSVDPGVTSLDTSEVVQSISLISLQTSG